jgi:hypothetical protein
VRRGRDARLARPSPWTVRGVVVSWRAARQTSSSAPAHSTIGA